MQYLIAFLEGIITFISPCLLPMLPIYISYFAAFDGEIDGGNSKSSVGRKKTLQNALGFVLGFTVVFVILGAFAGSMGQLLRQYSTAVNIVTGLIVCIFGLNYLGVFKIGFLNKTHKPKANTKNLGFLKSAVFGMVFSIGWTPCVGAFLGSALMLAAQQGSMAQGVVMLLCYSFGLSIPFIASALLIDRLKTAFDKIKRHYRVINIISGGMLLIVGILMMTGMMGYFLSLLSF